MYDLATDEGEEDDVVGEYPEVAVQMNQLMKTARRESHYWPLEK